MEISIVFKNADQIKNFLGKRPEITKEELNRAIEKSVIQVERQARINSPVDTGRMRTSIQRQTYESKIAGEVYVGVRYAIYVHEGTRYMTGRPFLSNAVRTMIPAIQRYFQEAIVNIINK